MVSSVDEQVIGMPAMSPAQVALMDELSVENPDERTVARNLSMSIAELRSAVSKLATHLTLPTRETPGEEFVLLARTSARLAGARAESARRFGMKVNGSRLPDASAQWQKKMGEVAAAIAKGVLITVDPYKIRPLPGQPRDYFPDEEQSTLEDSLDLIGQIQDIIIRKKSPPIQSISRPVPHESDLPVWSIANTEYEICDGERRWRGALEKHHRHIRAKLIEIDDEGAYLVAAVSNFNRVGHTTIERARNIKRLMEGVPPFPIEVVATMQGITKVTAEKLLKTLQLPEDVQMLMHPDSGKTNGHDVLGKMPGYEIARLAHDPVLHEYARDIAHRYVRREIKLPQVRMEVDKVLARVGAKQDNSNERHQPARRLKVAEGKLTLAINSIREAKGDLEDMKNEGVLPEKAQSLVQDLNVLADLAMSILGIVGTKAE